MSTRQMKAYILSDPFSTIGEAKFIINAVYNDWNHTSPTGVKQTEDQWINSLPEFIEPK
jgi:hypothetical protein